MKKRVLSIFAFAAIILFGLLTSCAGETKDKSSDNSEKAVVTEEVALDLTAGKAIYEAKCKVCHQENGAGLPPSFPPLAGSDYLMADAKRAVKQVLNGSNEEMVVNGVTYTMPMTPQVDNHHDAVAVINYVLNTWGNKGKTLTAEEVKDIEIVR